MKIGIITFHCAHNYGAVLQAYALQTYLSLEGHAVEIVDYRPGYLTATYYGWPKRVHSGFHPVNLLRSSVDWSRRLLKRLKAGNAFTKRRKGFENFVSRRFKLSARVTSPDQIGQLGYDAVIIGSDQVWNLHLIQGQDPVFMGDFSLPADTLKIAYAASAGHRYNKLAEAESIGRILSSYDAISVREPELAGVVKNIIGVDVPVVVDPALLLTREEWQDLATEPERERPYVLLFQVKESDYARKLAEHIAREKGLDLVVLCTERGNPAGPGTQFTASPDEFLGYFMCAEYVVTTSFHGTVFSTIFKRNLYFVSISPESDNRQLQLLNSQGLSDRVVSENEDGFPPVTVISWEDARENRDIIQHSRDFLYNSLQQKQA